MITPEEISRWLAVESAWQEHRRRTRGVDVQSFYAPFREYFLLHFEPKDSQAVRWCGNAIFKEVDGGGHFGYVEIVRAALADLRYGEILLADAPGKDDITKLEVPVAAVALHVGFEIGRLGDQLKAVLPRPRRKC